MEKGKIGNHRRWMIVGCYIAAGTKTSSVSITISLPASMLLTLSFCSGTSYFMTECKLKPVIACMINVLSCVVQIDRLFLGRFIIHDKIEPFYNINIVFDSFLSLFVLLEWERSQLHVSGAPKLYSLSMKSLCEINHLEWLQRKCFPRQFPVTIAVYSSQRLHWRRSTVSPVQLASKSGFAFIYGIGRSVAGILKIANRCTHTIRKNQFQEVLVPSFEHLSDEMFVCPSHIDGSSCSPSFQQTETMKDAIYFAFKRFSRSNSNEEKNCTNRFVLFRLFILVSTDFFWLEVGTMNNLWSPFSVGFAT